MRLLRDEPRSERPETLLGIEPTAETLLTALRHLEPPGCIAVYGGWGSGKTTLLSHVELAWSEHPEWGRAAWFNPWEYERREDLLTPLIYTVARATLRAEEPSTDRRARLKGLLAGIAKTTISLAARTGAAYLFGGAFDPHVNLSALAGMKPDELAKYFDEDRFVRFHDEVQAVKDRFRDLVDEVLGGKPDDDQRLVVFLDDLDRCQPARALAVVEGVKLLLCGDLTERERDKTATAGRCRALFVFGLDRHIVGEAIRQQYPGSTQYSGESYLEKIFDLSLEVPPVQDVPRLLRVAVGDDAHFKTILDQLGDRTNALEYVLTRPVFANPRVIKRVLNRLQLLAASAECAAQLQRITDERTRRLFYVWVAGAERYRGFRQFVRTASEHDLATLVATPPHDAVRHITDAPGFREYLALLGFEFRPEQDWRGLGHGLRRLLREGDGGQSPTYICEFEAILCSAGL